MAQELKIRISNHESLEEKLTLLGSSFLGEISFIDTYFNQPSGKVLKISKINNRYFLQRLHAAEGKFDFIEKQSIKYSDVEKMKADLTNKYGIKRILQGKRKNYKLEKMTITLNFIEDIGDFLILTGENPNEEFISKRLGIKNPEYVKVSFDELPSKKQEK